MTAYHQGTSGETYYAKPLPLTTATWAADVVSLTENGSTGQFAFTNDATKAYWIFEQATASPLATDTAVSALGVESAPDLVAIKTKTDQLAFTVANQVDANALSGGGGTNGNGQYQINLTAAVGATAVRNVRVSVEGTDTFAYTGTLGTAVLNVDAGSYTLIVTPPAGYEDVADVDVTVGTADEPVAIALVATTVTVPDDPTLATLIVKCLDETGTPEVGAVVYLQLVGIPTGSTGLSFDGLTQEATSIEGGIATLTIVKLAKYRIRRGGSQQWKEFTAGSGDSQTIVSFIGVDPVVT